MDGCVDSGMDGWRTDEWMDKRMDMWLRDEDLVGSVHGWVVGCLDD